MSNFACDKCGAVCQDSPSGYVTGCEHYPMTNTETSDMEILRDSDGIAHFIGLSGGKDSTCLALELPKREPRPYNFVCTPTGDELPEMEDHWGRLEGLIGRPLLRTSNGTLKSVIEQNKMLPNCHARFCTRILKLKPMGVLLEQHQPAISYVGLRDDEDEREGTRPGGDSAAIGSAVMQDFPFQRWGWGIAEVLESLARHGVTVPQRTDCARCPYQRLGEWYNLYAEHPDIYADAEADEAKYGHTYRSPKRDTWPASLTELRQQFESGRIPTRSLNMMEKRQNMCRACSL